MKVLKGKTIRKLKDKINNTTNNTNNKKKKSKPMIRKIEDGEDLAPNSYTASDIIGDIQEWERVSSKPRAVHSPSSVMDHPMDESPAKKPAKTMVDKVPSQLATFQEQQQEQQQEEELKVEPAKVQEEEQEEVHWKMQEPEIGEEIPDQDHLPSFSDSSGSSASSPESSESESDEDENDMAYTEFNGKPPVAIIGNIVLVAADVKQEEDSPKSPFSTAPTEPATPEEALKRSFTVESLSDDGSAGADATNYVHKATTYTVPEPEDEETKNLWKTLERNVELSQNLLNEFNCQTRVEETVQGLGYTIPKPDMTGVEVTVSDHPEDEQEKQQEQDAPRDEQQRGMTAVVGETIEKKSYIDVTQFQIPASSDHDDVANDTFQVPIGMEDMEMEESVLTVQMGNGLRASSASPSFEMPFDQQIDAMGPPPVMYPNIFAPPQIADEEEEEDFPEDEVDQEAIDFLHEIEDLSEDEPPPEEEAQQEDEPKESDSVFYGATLSVAKSVAEGVSTDSVVSVASKTAQTVASAANTLDQAAAPTLDTIFEKTSEMAPSVFDGFFENPKQSTAHVSKSQPYSMLNLNESFDSGNNSYACSEDAQMEPDVESVESRYGFDKTMDSFFASETFAAVSKHVPDFVMQLVADDDNNNNKANAANENQNDNDLQHSMLVAAV